MDSSFISTIFGACVSGGVAWYFHLRSSYLQQHIERLGIANKWQIAAFDTYLSLATVKDLYLPATAKQHPIERTLNIPVLIVPLVPNTLEVHEVSFLAASEQEEQNYCQWLNILRVSALYKNFNLVVQMWAMRNAEAEALKDVLVKLYGQGKGFIDLGERRVITAFGGERLVSLIHLTETAINLTDSLLIECDDFIQNSNKAFSQVVDTKIISGYGALLKPVNHGERRDKLNTRSKTFSSEAMSDLTGFTAEDIEKKINMGVYEDKKAPPEEMDIIKENIVLSKARAKRFKAFLW